MTAEDVRQAWEDLSLNPDDIQDALLDRAELANGEPNEWKKVLVVLANTIPQNDVN